MIFKNLFRRIQTSANPEVLVLVGLGNPGERYAATRHNAGFLAIEYLRDRFAFEPFRLEKKFEAQVSTGIIYGKKILLVKPETFMNESGRSVRAILDFYKLSPKELIVIHDDIDLAPGKMKQSTSSSSAGHNGVESIIQSLGTKDFTRLRLGIGRPIETSGACIPVHDYVLQSMSKEEEVNVRSLFPSILSTLTQRIKDLGGDV